MFSTIAKERLSELQNFDRKLKNVNEKNSIGWILPNLSVNNALNIPSRLLHDFNIGNTRTYFSGNIAK